MLFVSGSFDTPHFLIRRSPQLTELARTFYVGRNNPRNR
jgi:hypothetical protein